MKPSHLAAILFVAPAAIAALGAAPVAAEIYRPWCAQYTTGGEDGGATNCGFTSWEQCMATARGAGATCVQNPWYLWYGSGQKSEPPAARGRPAASGRLPR